MTTLGILLDNLQVTRFKNRFLAARQLIAPTGEPLYTYRTTSPEFADLREGLREVISVIPKPLRLERIARGRSWFPGLFVLYAAEWWRREYDGRGWTWEPIVQSLGASQDEWGQAQRSVCVEKGFDDWGISLTLAHGFRFLGSIALQGGLPMNLLAASQGNIGRVLSRVLQLAASSSAAEGEIEDWVESLSSYLPFTYRQPEIYRLLSQVITTVLSLKRRATLISPDDAISRLDSFDTEWRNRFPLPIEDRQAQGLIEQLVKDAVSTRSERTAAIATVDRRLERSDDDWRFRTTLRISEYVQASEIKRFFCLCDAIALPRLITLRLTVGSNTFDLSARRLAGRDCYRTDHRMIEFDGPDATSELAVSLVTTDSSTKDTILRKGEAIDPEQPWVFGTSDTDDTAIFLRQGGGSVASSAGLVCVKAQWQIQTTDASDGCQFVGTAHELGRDVYRFEGSIAIRDTAGSIFKLKSSQAAADDEYLGWSGSRAYDMIFDSPPLAFRGIPKLCRFTEEGTSVSVNSSVLWRMGTQRNTSAIGLHGPIEAIWPSSGDLRWRSGVVLLGDAKAASATSDGQTNAGCLCFSGWNLIGVRSLLAEVEITNHIDGPTLIADFRYKDMGCPPELCEVELLWRGNPNAARVRVPFPITGARVFDGKGRPLAQNATISAENIYGVRLVGFLDRNNHVTLRLTLFDRLGKGENISFHVVGAPDTRRINIRLVDYLPQIRRLLATTDSLDSFIEVELDSGSHEPARIRVGRYLVELSKDQVSNTVSIPDEVVCDLSLEVSELSARAIRLDSLNDEPLALMRTACDSQAIWSFPAESLPNAPWLIYPSKDSPVLFRPVLWNTRCPGTVEPLPESRSLALISRISDPYERFEALQTTVEYLAINFDEPDWAILEQFAEELSHLPLATLDVWRAFSHSAIGICAIALRTGGFPSSFFERFSSEMPCVWETIPLQIWVKCMTAYLQHVEKHPGLVSSLQNRIESIASVHPSLRALMEVAESLTTGQPTDDVRLARTGQINFHQILFSGETSPYQMLLRDRADAEWPTTLRTEIHRAQSSSALAFMRLSEPSFREAVVNLPILLAVHVATGAELDWSDPDRLRTLRKYQDFCPEWFSEAFDLTVARCVSEGLIDGLRS